MGLLTDFSQLPPFNSNECDEDDQAFLNRLQKLAGDPNACEEGFPLGQWLITTTVVRYPQLMPVVPRDLLWYFGGDCLQLLGEEEIVRFQHLDEMFYVQDSETDELQPYESLRAQIFGLH